MPAPRISTSTISGGAPDARAQGEATKAAEAVAAPRKDRRETRLEGKGILSISWVRGGRAGSETAITRARAPRLNCGL
jgi:hypothetical protein